MKNNNDINYDVFLIGDLVDLVVLSEDIIEKTKWYNWFNDEEVTKNMQKHYFPNTKTTQMEFYKSKIENNNKTIQLGIVNKKENLMIGVISLKSIDLINRNAEISIMIGEKEFQNIENFKESCTLLIDHGFKTLGLKRIYSGTFSRDIDNLFCKLLFFKSEGILKKAVYKNGQFHDVYLCAIIN